MKPFPLCLWRSVTVHVRAKHFPGVAIAILVLSLCGVGCNRGAEQGYAPEYSIRPVSGRNILLLGIPPYQNPQQLHEDYGPIIAYLNRNLSGVVIRLEASRSYSEFEKRMRERIFHFALPNPNQTLDSLKYGYRIFGKMGDDEKFRGVILVRTESGIRQVGDLKGKTLSFPAPTALAGTMMPLYFLHTHGVDANHDFRRLYTGSQESSIMNVYLGKSAAGATRLQQWEAFRRKYPDYARQLAVRWETQPLVNNGLVIRTDVSREIARKVASMLIALNTHDEGRRMLSAIHLSRFEPADRTAYTPVSTFMKRYSVEINESTGAH
jgi:phosphonate transport system substrate-binding protein